MSDCRWCVARECSMRPPHSPGDIVQLYFDGDDNPIAIYFDRTKKVLYSSLRAIDGAWSKNKVTTTSGPMSVGYNERSGEAVLSWVNRPKTDVFATELI